MKYEWDERKRLSKLKKHGLDFVDVGTVFETPHVVTPSTYVGVEKRYLAIRLFEGHYVTIVHTKRGNFIRVISFQRARHEERQEYKKLYGGGT